MMFADTRGEAKFAGKRKRRRNVERTKEERLALRDYAMRLLREKHKWSGQDIAQAFGVTERQAWRSLASMKEAIESLAS